MWRSTRIRDGAGATDDERAATYPPPYPAGWYRLAASGEIRKGRVRLVRALGRTFALFRGSGGSLGLVEAHCPHMGADLTRGRVRGDCLECPFHRWRIDAAGRVASVPSGRPPRAGRAVIGSWAVRDYYGMVVAYCDPHAEPRAPRARGSADPTPAYELPRIPEIDEDGFRCRGNHDAGIVRMHIAEFAENSVDPGHFDTIHGVMRLPWTRIRVPGIRIEHQATWSEEEHEPHVATFTDRARLLFRGREIPRAGAQAEVQFVGPGGVVVFRFEVPDLGRMLLLQTYLPVAPLRQRVHFRWYAPSGFPRLVAWYIARNWISQWRADVPIWEHKIYRDRPLLTSSDGPVMQMRRWYRRFYPAD